MNLNPINLGLRLNQNKTKIQSNKMLKSTDKYITYKGHKLSKLQVYNNLKKLLLLSSANDDHNWYKDAFKYSTSISKDLEFNLCENISKGCGIIAALSPVKSWDENQKCAESFITKGYTKHTTTFVNKAHDILNSDGSDESIMKILNGPKITSFYHNIRHPEKSHKVTIDRHALSCCFLKWATDDFYRGMTKNQYDWFECAMQSAADRLGLQPSKLQSVTWLVWRRLKTSYVRIDKKGVRISKSQKRLLVNSNELPQPTKLTEVPF